MKIKKVNFKGVGCRDNVGSYLENRRVPSYLYWHNIETMDHGVIMILA